MVYSAPAVSGGYETEYQDVLDAMTTDPTGDTLTWQNALVDSLVNRGYWERMPWLYVMMGPEWGDDEYLINWIDPGTFDATEVGAGALVYTDSAIVTDNVNYLSTNWNPTDDAGSYTLNDATIGMYCQYTSSDTDRAMGILDGNNDTYLYPYNSDQLTWKINTNTAVAYGSEYDNGIFLITRTASNATEGYRNGVSVGSNTEASTGLAAIDFRIFSYGTTGSVNLQVSFVFIMDGVSDAEALIITNILENYADLMGYGILD